MLENVPVKRLSIQKTRWPCWMSRSQRCEPMKPAPPVTKMFNSELKPMGLVLPAVCCVSRLSVLLDVGLSSLNVQTIAEWACSRTIAQTTDMNVVEARTRRCFPGCRRENQILRLVNAVRLRGLDLLLFPGGLRHRVFDVSLELNGAMF